MTVKRLLLLASCSGFLLFCRVGWGQEKPASDWLQEFHTLGIQESRLASRDMLGWVKPTTIAVALPRRVEGAQDRVREIVGDIEVRFVSSGTPDPAAADVFIGWCFPEALQPGSRIRYLHNYGAGMDRCSFSSQASATRVILSNGQKVASEMIAEHTIAMLLSLVRNLPVFADAKSRQEWNRRFTLEPAMTSVKGKVMLILGLGGIGKAIGSRAHALGMRVIATRNSKREGPEFVDYVGLSHEMTYLAAGADVVVNALPLTRQTRGMVGEEFFAAMKEGAYYISVGRGATTDTSALVAALKNKKLRGAGLDVTDPEPLPEGHPLWDFSNVVITPHVSGASDKQESLAFELAMENLRRYISGDRLLNLVDLKRGY